jgi:phospholipid N-methyltransferase
MARHVDLQGQGCIVELGGGTGSLTRALLRSGVPAGRLVVIEQSDSLAGYLRRRFPGIRVVEGDAAHIGELVDANARISTIVSGLPLCSLPKASVERITRACASRLAAGGRIVQFSYVWKRVSPWLGAGMRELRAEIEWINFPPAQVQVLGKALESQQCTTD